MRGRPGAIERATLGGSGAPFGGYYALSSFSDNEFNTGRWQMGLRDGVLWTDMQAIGGIAYGTQTGDAPDSGNPDYRDSFAILNGVWSRNQRVTAQVKTINQDGTSLNEIELWLRATIIGGHAAAYEILFSVRNGGYYTEAVRWNGARNSFTYVGSSGIGNITSVHLSDNDTVRADAIDDFIYIYHNGGLIGTVDLVAQGGVIHRTGNPGIACWRNNNGVGGKNNTDFGIRNATFENI